MIKRMREILQQDCNLDPEQPILVGVSGGADSLTLLDILVSLNYKVVVAHFNHLLRPEASEDARKVEELASKMDLVSVLGEGSAADYAQAKNLSVEEAARNLRYLFLFEQADHHNAQAVAVAHNADDQVETVLMHLLRGAGLDGLTGMYHQSLPNPWSKKVPLVRPLLRIRRNEIDAYCAENQLKPVYDPSNADTIFFRNRLRHKLIPELESYVPGFRKRLWQTADLLAADRILLDEITDKIWQDICVENGPGYVILNQESLNLQVVALGRRLVRRAISKLRPGVRDLDYALVQRVINYASRPTTTGQADLGLGLRISHEDDHLIISDWGTQLPISDWPQILEQVSLTIPGELDLGAGWILRAEIPVDLETAKNAAHENCDPYQAWIDLDAWKTPLEVRQRRPGERFRPLGMGGKSMKISDFMINQKIPRRARDRWPLVCDSDEIIWVPGFRLGYSRQIRENSLQIASLSLRLERVDSC